MKTAAIYCRSGLTNIAYQLGCTSAFIQDHTDQLELVGVYVDTDFSQWGKLLEAVYAGEVEVIVVQDFSILQMDGVIPDYPALIVGVYDFFFSDDKSRQLSAQLLVNFKKAEKKAEYNRNLSLRKSISEAHRQRFEERMQRGELHIKIPYGYRRSDLLTMELDPETAPIVRKIFEYAKNGDTPLEISRKLDGITTPSSKSSKWSPDTIKNILTNVAYVGYFLGGVEHRVLGKRVKAPEDELILIKDHHEGIVDNETFEIVQAIQKTKERAKKDVNVVEADPDLFKGIMWQSSFI